MNTYYISDVDSYTFVKKIASIGLKGPIEQKKCVRSCQRLELVRVWKWMRE